MARMPLDTEASAALITRIPYKMARIAWAVMTRKEVYRPAGRAVATA